MSNFGVVDLYNNRAMNKITKIIDNARSRLYYSQPVYIPGYEYSPWKKWLIISVVALFMLLIIASFISPNRSIYSNGNTNPNSNQSSAQTPPLQRDIQQVPSDLVYYAVDRVVDGDTIIVTIDGTAERIRLIGVDTPETVDPNKPVECFGPEASNYVKSLLGGKKVGLESDSSQGDKDKYNRLLRYVYLSDGTNVDEDIITKGYGHEYTYNLPYRYQDQFINAEQLAQSKKIGLWASNTCNGNTN